MKRIIGFCVAVATSFPLLAQPLPEHAVARLGTTRFRHAGGTTCVAFVDGGKLLVTAGNDQAIRLWDVKTGAEVRVMQPPPVKMSALADMGIPRQSSFFRIDVAADGSRAVSMDYHDGKMRLWDLKTGKLIREHKVQIRPQLDLPEFQQCVLSPDGKQLALLCGEANEKTNLRIVDAATGKPMYAPIVGKWAQIMSAVYSPDGKTIAWSALVNDKAAIRLFDAATGKERASSEFDETLFMNCCTFTPDNMTLICGGMDGLRLIDAQSGKIRKRVTTRNHPLAMAVHPGGKQAIVMSAEAGRLSVVDLETGKILRRVPGRRSSIGVAAQDNGTGIPSMLSITPDGKIFAVAGDDAAVRLYDFASSKEISPTGDHTAGIRLLRFGKDGKTLISGGGEGTIQTWDVDAADRKTSVRVRTGEGAAISLSPDNQLLAYTRNGDNLELRTLAGNKRLHAIRPEANATFDSVAFTPDGTRLVVFEYAESARARLFDVATKKEIRSITLSENAAFDAMTFGGLFSPCSRWLAMPSEEFNLDLIDLETGKSWRQITIPEEFTPYAMCYSPDSRTVLIQYGDEQLALYEVATGQLRRFLGKKDSIDDPFDIEIESILGAEFDTWDATPAIAVSPDFALVAMAQFNGRIGIWDIAQGKRIAVLPGHRGRVRCLAFSTDGKRLASGSEDTTILIWDLSKFTRPSGAVRRLTDDDFRADWKRLLDSDAETAYAAIERLSQPAALSWMSAELLKPPPKLDVTRLAAWIEDLDNPRYSAREKATIELSRLGDDAAPYLRKALAGRPTAEAARRLRDLLERTGPYNLRGEKLRQWRALEVLERIRTPESRELLRKLAAGPPERLLTVEAQIALKR